MKETIDLYTKLVIGTFSFIGPSFTLLISLFFNAIQKSREKHQSQIENLAKLIKTNLGNTGSDMAIELKAASKKLNAKLRENRNELNLLNPKRQVVRVFGSLLISIGLIGFYYFQHSSFSPVNSRTFRAWTILLSGLSFTFSLLTLWQIFCTIIRVRFEEQNKLQPNLALQPKEPSVSNPSNESI